MNATIQEVKPAEFLWLEPIKLDPRLNAYLVDISRTAMTNLCARECRYIASSLLLAAKELDSLNAGRN